MIQTKPYEFMVSYTPQTEWIEKGGVKLWLAFFFIELGAGMFLIASLFDNFAATAVGWLLCAVLGGGLHLLYLGKPLRFWRMAFSSGWKTSWISRGIIFVSFFLMLGFIHMALLKWQIRVTGLLVAADIFAFLTIIYGGFAMNYVNGISLWNTALLPVIYGVSGLWGGAEVTLGIALGTGTIEIGPAVEEWIRILLVGYLFLIPVYLHKCQIYFLARSDHYQAYGSREMVTRLLGYGGCVGHGGAFSCRYYEPGRWSRRR
jgi:formate-dependent nitrite reductase membrane component NrfD